MLVFAFFTALLVTPILLVWGWMRWSKGPRSQNVCAALSWVGFLFATVSAGLAIITVFTALVRPFPFYDPVLLFIYRVAFLLAIPGMVAALAGIWKPGPLRWHAPLCVAGTTFFWLMMASGE